MKRLIPIFFVIILAGCFHLRKDMLPFLRGQNIEEELIMYIRTGQYGLADTLCMRWLERHPRDWKVHALYGIILMYEGDYRSAIDHLSIATVYQKDEDYIAYLINLSLAYLYNGDLLEYCETVDRLIWALRDTRVIRSNEALLIAIAKFIRGENDFQDLLNPIEATIFTNSGFSDIDQRILDYWRKIFTFRGTKNDKIMFIRLLAQRPTTPVLPQTTLSSFVVSIIAEKTNPRYLKPIIVYGR